MNIIERAKNIILKPKAEWAVIDQEPTSIQGLFTNYLLIIALIPAISTLIGLSFFSGGFFFLHGMKFAIYYYILIVGGIFISAYIIDALASNFGAVKDNRKALQLVTYSFTPMMAAGFFYIIPDLGFLAGLAGLYGIYILYLGFNPMMKVPEDKTPGYFIISILVIIAVGFILNYILKAIIFTSALVGYGLGM